MQRQNRSLHGRLDLPEYLKGGTVETNQTAVRTDPEVSVPGLSDAVHRPPG